LRAHRHLLPLLCQLARPPGRRHADGGDPQPDGVLGLVYRVSGATGWVGDAAGAGLKPRAVPAERMEIGRPWNPSRSAFLPSLDCRLMILVSAVTRIERGRNGTHGLSSESVLILALSPNSGTLFA